MEISELYKIFCASPVVTTDTRDCPAGSIFFALRGASFNGNEFAQRALEAGCSYAVVDEPAVAATDSRMLLVDDCLEALQQLAAYHRKQLATPIVQITGTNGKTTTKELVAAVLSEKHHVLFTQGNFNNHIGVPKTLLRLTAEHDIAVVETGANHPGEIALLSKITDADCGLITNVGMAHLEGFGPFEGGGKTKGELYDYQRQKPGAFVFLHADNPHLSAIAEGLQTVRYGGVENGCDVEGEVVACNPFLQLRWRKQGGQWHEVQTHLVGSYNLSNVLAAVAVGLHFGVDETAVSHALEAYVPTNNRSELKDTGRNRLIVDAYNANPTSMAAALENFRLIDHPHKMLVLGEMRELGEASAEAHARVVEQVEALSLEDVWLVGAEFAKVAAGKYRCFDDVEAVKQALAAAPVSGRLVLIKGSNGTRLYQLPESF